MNKAEKIAAIVAIVEIFKYYGTPHKVLPIFAILIAMVLEYADNPTPQGIIDGLINGAIATGSYGIIKNSAQGIMKKDIPPPDTSLMDDDRCV